MEVHSSPFQLGGPAAPLGAAPAVEGTEDPTAPLFNQPLVFGQPEPEPTVAEAFQRPPDLQEAPSRFDLWPPQGLKTACPLCGNWGVTAIEEETGQFLALTLHARAPLNHLIFCNCCTPAECVGCLSLCSDGPLFRDANAHFW